MILGHIPEILGLLLLALLVFGPKRMIDMGSSVGKMFRELRDATRDMSWSNLMGDTSDAHQNSTSQTSQTARPFGASRADANVPAPTGANVVDGSIEHPHEP